MNPAKAFAVLLLLGCTGCSASTQKPAVDAVLDDPALRRESFEATLRVLDENPEYVDELFAATLRHPVTLERFIENTSRGLAEERLSRITARHLAQHPNSLRQTMIANLDAVSNKPEGLHAIAQAMSARPEVSAMALVQREDAIRLTMDALIAQVMKNERARAAFLVAMQENSPELATLVVRNPAVMKALVASMAKVGVNSGKEELNAFVQAVSADGD